MKKLLLLLTFTAMISPVFAADREKPTDTPVRDFISNGGFKGLCDELGGNWGYDSALLGGMGSYACYSNLYIKFNRIDTFTPAD